MHIKGKKVVVVGLGVTGYYTALWACSQGATVLVTDIRPSDDFDTDLLKELAEKGIILELGGHDKKTIETADMVIPSPGVPTTHGPVHWAKALGVPIVSELDIVNSSLKVPVVAITGTNGKSTVTTLIGKLLCSAGLNAFVGGNLGVPAIKLLVHPAKYDYLVLEVSSFQLDICQNFRPHIGILLNITPDHLDRYSSFDEYVHSKLSLFKNQTETDYAILNRDDAITKSNQISIKSKTIWYGLGKNKEVSAYIQDGQAIIAFPSGNTVISLDSYKLIGKHNISNLLPVLITGCILKINKDTMEKTLAEFEPLPHRMEFVREFNGRKFIDDSKATNVDAAAKAVASLDGPVVVILGGRHKGADYSPILDAGKTNLRYAVLMGEAKELIAKSFEGKLEYSFAHSMEEAVKMAYAKSCPGDFILLSPACSSFDMFVDYKHRGDEFKKIVRGL